MGTISPAAKILLDYTEKGYNILTPAITPNGLNNIAERHEAVVEATMISPDYGYGDVWAKDDKTYIISKQGIDRLSILANVLWHEHGGSERTDDESKRDFIRYKAFAAVRTPNGSLAPAQANYDIDLIAVEDDLRYRYREKGSKGKYKKTGQALDDYVEHCVGRDMRFKRNHLGALCESGARNRVNRWLLGLRKTYSREDLLKPFVVVKVSYQPDYENPDTRRIADMIAMGASASLFGPGAQQQVALPAPESQDVHTIESDDPEQPPETNGDADPLPEFDQIDTSPPDDTPGEFGLWDRDSQIRYIKNLSTRKGYNLNALFVRMKKGHGDLSETDILAIFDKLTAMDDVPFDDDIPF